MPRKNIWLDKKNNTYYVILNSIVNYSSDNYGQELFLYKPLTGLDCLCAMEKSEFMKTFCIMNETDL